MIESVIAHHDRALGKMRRYQLNRRSGHSDPNVPKDEVNRPINPLERLTKIAFTKLDELAYARLCKIRARRFRLFRLVLGPDNDAAMRPLIMNCREWCLSRMAYQSLE